MIMIRRISIGRPVRRGLAALVAAVLVGGTIAPAAARGSLVDADAALQQLGEAYGSASFRHHFYRNVPNRGLSADDYARFRDAQRDADDGSALAPL